jgi:hypothetical protein
VNLPISPKPGFTSWSGWHSEGKSPLPVAVREHPPKGDAPTALVIQSWRPTNLQDCGSAARTGVLAARGGFAQVPGVGCASERCCGGVKLRLTDADGALYNLRYNMRDRDAGVQNHHGGQF